VVWEVKGLGGGYSNPVVAGGRVFVLGRKAKGKLKGWGSQECEPEPDVLSCLDRTNGKVLWRHDFPFHVKADKSTAWSTPAVDGDRVYARGGDGEVRCLSVQDGKQLWSWPKDKGLLEQKENSAHSGYAGALTVEGDLAIFQGIVPGGRKAALVAVDKKTGDAKWEAPIRPWLHAACNPVLVEVKGKRLMGIAGQILDPLTGKKIGECPIDDWWAGHHGNLLVVRLERELKIPKEQEAEEEKKYGEGFKREAGVQCLALDLKDDGSLDVRKLWEWSVRGTAEYEPKGTKDFGGPIIAGGYAYTFIGVRTQGNRLLCLDLATGKELWTAKIRVPLGTSHPLYADGKIFVLNNGRLLMIAADPKEYRELGHAQVSLQSWAAPALSDGHLFLRDDSGTVKCLDLRAQREPRKVARPPSEKARTTDWPQLGGPKGDWTSAEKGLADKWPGAGPKVVWEARTEPGFASPIVAHGHVYLLGRKGWGIKKNKDGQVVMSKEGKITYECGGDAWSGGEGPLVLRCLDRTNGKEVWRYTYKKEGPARCGGPYITPIADADKVYAIDGARELVCLQASDGKVVWSHVGSDILGGPSERQGAADRLLIVGDSLVCVGQVPDALQVNVLDKATGEFRWAKYFRPPTWQIKYTTPGMLATEARQSLLLAGADVLACLGLDSDTLWESRVKDKQEGMYDPWTFLATGSRFYVYKEKALEAFQAADTADGQGIECKRLWTADARSGGILIPLDDRLVHVSPGGDRRFVRAREAETGKPLWEGRVEKAELSGGIAADGKLILTTTRNELILAQANGPEFRILSRAVIDGFESCWSPAAFSEGQLFLRDCTGLVKCFDLRSP
jgi:outer membrane protein assembly factor BamB